MFLYEAKNKTETTLSKLLMKVHYFHLDDIIDNDEAKEILYLKKISGFSHDEMISLKDNTETKDESCCVYLMIDTVNNYHKIGISNNPEVRESTLQREKPSIELMRFFHEKNSCYGRVW